MAGYLGTQPRAATQARNITGNVSDESLVENRIGRLTASDSRYMQQATARGNQDAAARGLLSSSIATGAVEGQRLAAALPIAQQDAATYAARDSQDTAYRQQGALNEQQYGNTAALADQSYGNQRGLNQQQFGFNTQLQGQQIQGQKDLSRQGYIQNRGLNEQQFGHNSQLQTQQGDITSRLQGEQFGYNSQLQGQQGEITSRLQGEQFGYSSQLADQQGRIQSDLSTQGFQQQGSLNEQQISANRESAAITAVESANARFSSESAAIRSNPNLSTAEQTAAIQELENFRQNTIVIATRGTELQGQFRFAPEQRAIEARQVASPSLQPPPTSPGPGRRWQFDNGSAQWVSVAA